MMISSKDTLDVIIPVYNEKEIISRVLREWKKELDALKIKYSFIVCEDGSTDGTKELLVKLKPKYNLILHQKLKRRGYGQAIVDGIGKTQAKYVLCIDSDGQCDPKELVHFWENRKNADVIMGWRVKRVDPLQRKLFYRLFKIFFDIIIPNSVHDPSAPLFKRLSILPYLNYLKYMREGFWWGFAAVCKKKGLSTFEIEIKQKPRHGGRTKIYRLKEIPAIAFRNVMGLIKLRLN